MNQTHIISTIYMTSQMHSRHLTYVQAELIIPPLWKCISLWWFIIWMIYNQIYNLIYNLIIWYNLINSANHSQVAWARNSKIIFDLSPLFFLPHMCFLNSDRLDILCVCVCVYVVNKWNFDIYLKRLVDTVSQVQRSFIFR